MGAPFFQERERLQAIGARVFSSNYTLYADMSRRVMATLETPTPDVEVYSIDEAFLSVPTPPGTPAEARADAEAWAHALRAARRCSGPASRSASRSRRPRRSPRPHRRGPTPAAASTASGRIPRQTRFLLALPVTDVWGVAARSRRQAARRRADGGRARRARRPPHPAAPRRRRAADGLRVARRLVPAARARARSAPLARPLALVRAAAHGRRRDPPRRRDACRAGGREAARRGARRPCRRRVREHEGHGAGPHRTGSSAVALGFATNRSAEIIRAALLGLARAHQAADASGQPFRYRKAGVTLWDIGPAEPAQAHLFRPPAPEQDALHAALDSLNGRYGRRTVFFAAMGTAPRPVSADRPAPAWAMQQSHRSPRYTTRWPDLVRATA